MSNYAVQCAANITATAQVEEPEQRVAIVLCDQELENRTIERCALMAKNTLHGELGEYVAAAVRKLKDPAQVGDDKVVEGYGYGWQASFSHHRALRTGGGRLYKIHDWKL